MHKKLFFIATLQVTCIIAFALTALACRSTANVTAPTIERAPHAECENGDYLYIGKSASANEAKAVANSNNLELVVKDKHGRYFGK